MMGRWGHGHSAGGGFLLALALSGHLLTLLVGALLLGVALGRGWGAVGSAMRRLGGASAHRALLERERWLEVRARRRSHLERSRSLRADREKGETAAYWKGVGDASP